MDLSEREVTLFIEFSYSLLDEIPVALEVVAYSITEKLIRFIYWHNGELSEDDQDDLNASNTDALGVLTDEMMLEVSFIKISQETVFPADVIYIFSRNRMLPKYFGPKQLDGSSSFVQGYIYLKQALLGRIAPSLRAIYTSHDLKIGRQAGSKRRKSTIANGVRIHDTCPICDRRFSAAFNPTWRPIFESREVYFKLLESRMELKFYYDQNCTSADQKLSFDAFKNLKQDLPAFEVVLQEEIFPEPKEIQFDGGGWLAFSRKKSCWKKKLF